MGVSNSNKRDESSRVHKPIPLETAKREVFDTLNKRNELSMGHKPAPLGIANKLSKSICKITYYTTNKINGTGFFMKYNSLKYLISVNHVINSNLINKNIELEIYNEKKINLNLNNRYIKLFEEPIDISVIEIKDLDEINKEDIEYLNYDLNYKIEGYLVYK